MEPTVRIRTKVGNGKVFTLYFRGEWVTIMSGIGASKSTAAKSLYEASENHLAYCKILKEKQNVQGGRISPSVLHQPVRTDDDPGTVPDGHDLASREGSDGSGGAGREPTLPTDDSSQTDKESLQLKPQESELKKEESQ
jgi:hypothetical protein